jgi:CysZ protein
MAELFKKDIKIKSAFLKGFWVSFASFGLMGKNKSILLFYIVPFLLNIFLLSAFIYLAFTNIAPLLRDVLSGNEEYHRILNALLAVLNFLITPILLLFLLYLATVAYGFIGNILCSSFLDKLSQKTQETVSGRKIDTPFSLKYFPKRFEENFIRTFKNFFKMLALVITISLLSMFLLLIPIIGAILYSALGYITTSFILGLQFMDYPLNRKKYTFGEKLKIAWKFKYTTIGLGMSFLIISMIPILGYLGINMCVMGASIIFEKDISATLLEYDVN